MKTTKKSTRKSGARKTSARNGARKSTRAPARASRRSATRRATDFSVPQGYVRTNSGVLVPIPANVIPAEKLRRGLPEARRQLEETIGHFLDALGDGYDIAEIELSASFSADGKFLGFGVGGAASMTLRIRPTPTG